MKRKGLLMLLVSTLMIISGALIVDLTDLTILGTILIIIGSVYGFTFLPLLADLLY